MIRNWFLWVIILSLSFVTSFALHPALGQYDSVTNETGYYPINDLNSRSPFLSDGIPTLDIATQRNAYVPGEIVIVGGTVLDGDGNPVNTKVNLEVFFLKNDGERPIKIYQTNVIAIDSNYYDTGISTLNPGKYNVTATVTIQNATTTAWTTFEVKSPFETFASFIGYVGIAAFVCLTVIIYKGSTIEPNKRELSRFICITIIAFTPIAVSIFTDVQIGQRAPIGLVLQPQNIPGDVSNTPPSQWVINVGGSWSDNYAKGIQIPVFVFIFGWAGGYIRYLYVIGKTLWEDKVSKDDDWEDNARKAVFARSIGDLSLLFLAPLLAIATYFILLQAGIKQDLSSGLPTMAAVCFGVGLATDKIVQRLEEIVGQAISSSKDSGK